MTSFRSTRATACLALGVVVLVAACSGSTSSGAPSIGPSAITSAPPPAPAGSGGLVLPSLPFPLPSFDSSSLTAGLANVDSYKVAITLGGDQSLTGTVVTKPVLSRDYTMQDGTHVVVISDQAWVGKAGTTPQQVPSAIAQGLFAVFDPTLLVGAFSGPAVASAATDQGKETKNGVQATHYHVDSTSANALAGLPAGATIDLWIADAGYLVALEAKGFPKGDFNIQVTDVDNPANQVVAPS